MILEPCPFCDGTAEVERVGTARVSCIVVCTNCGCRLESNEIGYGVVWNSRALQPGRVNALEVALTRIEENLRIGAAPIVDLVNTHGDRKQKEAWRFGVYASAIQAQVVVGDERMRQIREAASRGAMRTEPR